MSTTLHAALALAALAIAGCAATSSVTATDLLRSFVDSLRATGKFPVVGTEGPREGSKGLDVTLVITGLNYVSGASRELIGIAAGRAVLNVTLRVTDMETKEALGATSAGHASHHGQGVFSPTTGRQAEAIGKELAARLAQASKR